MSCCLLSVAIRPNSLLVALQYAAPVEIIWDMAAGYAMTPGHPAFQSAVIGIEVVS